MKLSKLDGIFLQNALEVFVLGCENAIFSNEQDTIMLSQDVERVMVGDIVVVDTD